MRRDVSPRRIKVCAASNIEPPDNTPHSTMSPGILLVTMYMIASYNAQAASAPIAEPPRVPPAFLDAVGEKRVRDVRIFQPCMILGLKNQHNVLRSGTPPRQRRY